MIKDKFRTLAVLTVIHTFFDAAGLAQTDFFVVLEEKKETKKNLNQLKSLWECIMTRR